MAKTKKAPKGQKLIHGTTFEKTGSVDLDNLFAQYFQGLTTLRRFINARNPAGIQIASANLQPIADLITSFLNANPEFLAKAQPIFQQVAQAFSG